MRKIFLLFLLLPFFIQAQNRIERVEPPFWWTGMNNTKLQIMLYGEDIAYSKPEVNYQGVTIDKTVLVENDNYIFLYLNIAPEARSGGFTIDLRDRKNEIIQSVDYQLLERESDPTWGEGFDNSDVMYLVTPDRFANGNTDNDNVKGMLESADRSDKDGRHGGDIQGVMNHLDYFEEMGYTAIWFNPLLENNQPKYSYHGYSTTDYYKIDPRIGTNKEYRELVNECRKRGIKVLMDIIVNHCGSEHWWMKDLPSKDWINNVDKPFYTNHRRTTFRDPHASKYDLDHFENGWFVKTMPDMNQRNPLISDYLIQNSIWWIEYVGLGGIRMDTYPYSGKDFMSDWSCAIMDEYPNFNICGEDWSLNPVVLAYWQKGKVNPDGFTSCLPGLLDFPLQHAWIDALKEKAPWGSDMSRVYEMLANDFIYPNPNKHVIFPDNHDVSRILTQLNEDKDLLKLTIAFYATMRGTPQFYYGTDILMSNKGDNSHGNIRSDFPGGWKGDAVNAFSGKGLTQEQKEWQQFVKKILNWRKKTPVIHDGKLMHFAPQHHVYVYFRYDEKNKVMVLLNKADEAAELDLVQFEEMLGKQAKGKDIISNKTIVLQNKLTIGAKQPMIIEIE